MNEKKDAIRCDPVTAAWFAKHRDAQTTVVQCEKCGLFYKALLGHKCKGKPAEKTE